MLAEKQLKLIEVRIRSQKSNLIAFWKVIKFTLKSLLIFFGLIFLGDALVAIL